MNMPYTLPLEEQAYLSTLLTQPHRHYHNIIHVNDCLAEAYKMFNEKVADEHKHLTYAIWYHDAIYNPYSKSNEDASIALLPDDAHNLSAVIEAIEATKFHTEDQTGLSWPTMLMLDIDLSGFGKSFEVCWKHAENIRKEYYHTPDLDFLKGRVQFLSRMDNRTRIYYTPYFYDKYEVQARKNIAEELIKTKLELRKHD